MASSLDSRDGRSELEGKEGQGTASRAPGSHVTYGVEEEGDGTRSGPTMMQKVRGKMSEYEDYLKGTDSSDPHPELAYIPPGEVEQLQEGKQHGGVPTAALGHDVPAHVATDYVSSVKHDDKHHEGHKKHMAGAGADEPTVMERIREKMTETGNKMKGVGGADPHPELAYISPQPQEHQEGLFSRMEHKFGGQQQAPKGTTASTEVGTGYEEDSEDKLNPKV